MNGQPAAEKTALITGASSGFGLLTTLRLARLGWTVYAGYRDPGALGPLTEAAERAGAAGRVRTIRLDVTDETDIREAVRVVRQEAGRLDALIHNAGYAAGGFVEELPLDVWQQQFAVNVFGVARLTREALPLMRETGGGRIVMVSSISGRIGFPGMGPYCASKHALEGMGEALRLELAPFGISVSIVEPGAYRTPIWRKSLAAVHSPAPDSPYAAMYERLLPIVEKNAENGGDPERVAETIVRAVTDKKPRLRYLPGWGERSTLLAMKLLPRSWIERAMLRALGAGRR